MKDLSCLVPRSENASQLVFGVETKLRAQVTENSLFIALFKPLYLLGLSFSTGTPIPFEYINCLDYIVFSFRLNVVVVRPTEMFWATLFLTVLSRLRLQVRLSVYLISQC